MSKQTTRRAIIEYAVAKPFVDATALGVGSSALAIVLQGPALNWGLLGAGFSLFWFWGSVNLTRPKRRGKSSSPASVGAGTVVINSVNGSRKMRLGAFEYAPYDPGSIKRDTWDDTLRRWVWGRPEEKPAPEIDKPTAPREFVFQSHYDGLVVELREGDVRRFLRTAWKERQRGRGLSNRRWVREWKERPQWYKDLGPHWYRALLVLLREAQLVRKCQIVVCTGPNWYALARDPHITLALLREAEVMKGNAPQPPAPEVPEIDPGFSISFDRGESSFDG